VSKLGLSAFGSAQSRNPGRRLRKGAIACVSVVFVVSLCSCTESAPKTARRFAAHYEYRCCAHQTGSQVYRAGSALKLHWRRELMPPVSRPVEKVTLRANLLSPTGSVIASARVLRTTDEASSNPISRIVVPKSVTGGRYVVRTSVTTVAGSVVSRYVVRIRH
jgi:hypothetical protein